MSFRLNPRAWAATLGLLLTTALAVPTGSASYETNQFVSVIVQGVDAASSARAVSAIGGRVEHRLPIIDGVSASVPKSSLPVLRSSPFVSLVSPNALVKFENHTALYDVDAHRVQSVVRSDETAAAGYTGKGVTVAIVDTGVFASHPDLQGPAGSRVIACSDFSIEAGTSLDCVDSFGHGTFMAGLIAGNGASSSGRYVGTAPDARIVSAKVAGSDGSTDVSQVLAGIQWVVAHRDVYGTRVLNLSLGTDSKQDFRRSPLNFAVERAWMEGITVVVSGGNSGPYESSVTKPADDPWVITVGSSDDQGTMSIADDTVPAFSSRGPTQPPAKIAKPDVLAPGVRTVSLRAPGSAIDSSFGASAAIGSAYFRGTGTSMSAATVSGIVAQMLERSPQLSPGQVKFRLMSTARPLAGTDVYSAGAGVADAYSATMSAATTSADPALNFGNGLGSLHADRGSVDLDVKMPPGQMKLHGESVTAADPADPNQLLPWSRIDYTNTGWDATSWKATSWKATSWKATSWKTDSWNASSWQTLSNPDWDATSWKGVHWDATSWKATSWKSVWYAAAWE